MRVPVVLAVRHERPRGIEAADWWHVGLQLVNAGFGLWLHDPQTAAVMWLLICVWQFEMTRIGRGFFVGEWVVEESDGWVEAQRV